LGQDVRRRAEWRGVRDLGRAHKAEAFNFGFDSALLTIDSVTVNSALFDFLPDGAGSAVGDTGPNIDFDSFVNNPASGMFSIATISPTAGGTPGTASLSILGSSEFYSATAALSPTLLPGHGEYCARASCGLVVWFRADGVNRHRPEKGGVGADAAHHKI
jgi:hypothetical protein